MSQLNSSLALVEIEEQFDEMELNLIVNPRYLSISNTTFKEQSEARIVKIKGSITVSF